MKKKIDTEARFTEKIRMIDPLMAEIFNFLGGEINLSYKLAGSLTGLWGHNGMVLENTQFEFI